MTICYLSLGNASTSVTWCTRVTLTWECMSASTLLAGCPRSETASSTAPTEAICTSASQGKRLATSSPVATVWWVRLAAVITNCVCLQVGIEVCASQRLRWRQTEQLHASAGHAAAEHQLTANQQHQHPDDEYSGREAHGQHTDWPCHSLHRLRHRLTDRAARPTRSVSGCWWVSVWV